MSCEMGTASTLSDTRSPASDGRDGDELRRGDVVDRYVVLSQVGRGGMGVVYAAYDPQLDRKVALKLHVSARGEGPDARTRMLREAQAMAQIHHPSVVTVHDLGTWNDRVWIVMEFVSGRTLTQWIGERRRRWAEVVALFVRIGEGLHVAHAAGLVHRDIKPENVMVEAAGGVRILDFGLARGGAPDVSRTGSIPGVVHASALDVSLTLDGALLGTPRYMAPEQWEGAAIDPRTDQFAFCVALWEALFGQPPFPGATVPELALAVLAGRVPQPPAGARVPGRVRRAVQRGLAVDPGQRWPSMQHLLAELRRTPIRRKRLLAGLVGGLAVAGAVVGPAVARTHDLAACDAEAAQIDDVWNPAAAASLREAMLATALPFARASADRTIARFDEHARAWTTTRRSLCERSRVSGTLDPDALARAEACLDDRRVELEVLVARLREGGRETTVSAVDAATGFLSPARCADPQLRSYTPTPAGSGAFARHALARAFAEISASRYPAAGAALAEVERILDRVDLPGLEARARLGRGLVRSAEGRHAEAATQLEAAVVAADRIGDPWMLAEAAIRLAWVVGVQQEQHAQGLVWGRLAEMWWARDGDDRQRIRLGNTVASVHYARGAYDEARASFASTLAVAEATLAPEHPMLADLVNNLGAVESILGEYDAALASLTRARSLIVAARGPDHPELIEVLINLGNVHSHRRAFADARAAYESALRLGERVFGPDHPDLLPALQGLGYVVHRGGDLQAAGEHLRRALTIAERSLGPEHPSVGRVLNNLGALAEERGDLDGALASHMRALELRSRVLGRDHHERADSLSNLGEVLAERGELAAARDRFAEALQVRERALGPDHPEVFGDALELARAQVALREPEPAIAALERMLATPSFLAGDPVKVASARLVLARAVADPARARALADAALAALAPADLEDEDLRRDLSAFRAGRR
jgi:tetratricopeptide (TPR) repeat protein